MDKPIFFPAISPARFREQMDVFDRMRETQMRAAMNLDKAAARREAEKSPPRFVPQPI